MQNTYEELIKERDRLQVLLQEVEDKISSSPESYSDLFPEISKNYPAGIEWIKKHVESIKPVDGIFDFRKNEMSYSGYSFNFPGQETQEYRHGSNWCSSWTELCEPSVEPGSGREIRPWDLDEKFFSIFESSQNLEDFERDIATVTNSKHKILTYLFYLEQG